MALVFGKSRLEIVLHTKRPFAIQFREPLDENQADYVYDFIHCANLTDKNGSEAVYVYTMPNTGIFPASAQASLQIPLDTSPPNKCVRVRVRVQAANQRRCLPARFK
jgi:hypothetical protein